MTPTLRVIVLPKIVDNLDGKNIFGIAEEDGTNQENLIVSKGEEHKESPTKQINLGKFLDYSYSQITEFESQIKITPKTRKKREEYFTEGASRIYYNHPVLYQILILRNYTLREGNNLVIYPTYEITLNIPNVELAQPIVRLINERFFWKIDEQTSKPRRLILEAYLKVDSQLSIKGKQAISPFFPKGTVLEARMWNNYQSLQERVIL